MWLFIVEWIINTVSRWFRREKLEKMLKEEKECWKKLHNDRFRFEYAIPVKEMINGNENECEWYAYGALNKVYMIKPTHCFNLLHFIWKWKIHNVREMRFGTR